MSDLTKNLRYNITATDGSSPVMEKAAASAERTGVRISTAFTKAGGIIGGEFGEVLDKLGDGLSVVEEKSGRLGETITALGAGVAGTGAILTVMGSKEKAAGDQLKQAIDDTGNSYSDYGEEIEKTIKREEDFNHSAVDTQNALTQLTEATQDPTKAIDDMSVATDLAAAKHESLAEAATQLSRVYAGNSKILKQYGIDTKVTAGDTAEADAAIGLLAQRLQGQGAAAVDNFGAKVDIVRTKLGDWVAEEGAKYGPTITAVGTAVTGLGGVVQLLTARRAAAAAAAAAAGQAELAEAAASDKATAATARQTITSDDLTAAMARLRLAEINAGIANDGITASADAATAAESRLALASEETATTSGLSLGTIGAAAGKAGLAIAAITVGLGAADSATKGWQNQVGTVAKGFSDAMQFLDPASGHFFDISKIISDRNATGAFNTARHLADQIGTQFADQIESSIATNGIKVSGGIAQMFDAATGSASSSTLTGLAAQYGDLTTAMQNNLTAAQALDGEGAGQKITIDGVRYVWSEYENALSKTNGNVENAITLMGENRDAVAQYSLGLQSAKDDQSALSTALEAAATTSKLTTDQVSLYAAAVGISAENVADGTITTEQFSSAIGGVSSALSNASTANAAWLDSVSKFESSGKTAADTATLIAAAIQAGRGAALDYADADLSAAAATETVASTIGKYSSSISSAGDLLGQLTKTSQGYRILQPQLTDGSLQISQALTQMATTAQTAAAQTYQNEVATKGGAAAADDAIGVYLGYRAELERQAEQAGLTAGQAQTLADKYLGMPKNVQTFIKQVGEKDVDTAISDLTIALNNLTKVIATPGISLQGAQDAIDQLTTISGLIDGITGSKPVTPPNVPGLLPSVGSSINITTSAQDSGGSSHRVWGGHSYAGGGTVSDGWSLVGEGGFELLHKSGPNVSIVPNPQAQAITGWSTVPGFAGGTSNMHPFAPPTINNTYNLTLEVTGPVVGADITALANDIVRELSAQSDAGRVFNLRVQGR